jgi:hypothetical protein
MNRMFVAVMVAAIATAAGQAFAAPDEVMMRSDVSGSAIAADAGTPVPMVIVQGALPAKGEAVSGTVMVSTPGEIVLHTSKGLQTFEITPKTEMLAGPAEGENVTVMFAPAPGSVSGSARGSAAVVTRSRTRVADLALAVLPPAPGVASR